MEGILTELAVDELLRRFTALMPNGA